MWNKENWIVTFLLTLLGIRIVVGDFVINLTRMPRRLAAYLTTL
jgi:hypothetical protein